MDVLEYDSIVRIPIAMLVSHDEVTATVAEARGRDQPASHPAFPELTCPQGPSRRLREDAHARLHRPFLSQKPSSLSW